MSVIGLGEVLWDMLPQGRQLGGAPANVAYHADALGMDSVIISAVGSDRQGSDLLEKLQQKGIETEFVQIREEYPTGTVEVTLDQSGKPDYIIHENVAWDHIRLSGSIEKLVSETKALCFGTLAQRSPESRETIQNILKRAPESCIRVYDVNLRQNFYTTEILLNSLRNTDILKINDEELPVVCGLTGITGDEDGMLRQLKETFSLDLVALTMGSRGSRLSGSDDDSFLPTPDVNVVDTVGAGDSFTAALIHGLLHGRPLEQIHRSATELAAFVCTQKGATPQLSKSLLEKLLT